MRYGKTYGGANPQLIEGDLFRMILAVPEFREKPQPINEIVPTTEVTTEVTPEVHLIQSLEGEMTRKGLQAALGLRDDEHFRKTYLLPALDAGLIEMTIPDKPRSSKQKYRVTDKGRKLLKTSASKKITHLA